MRGFTLFSLFVALALCADVVDLDDKTFDKFIADHDYVFVKFFAPWCGHCKALAPEYEKAAKMLKEENIILAQVDCDAHSSVCSKFDVSGYPTLKHFKKGVPSDYEGARTADALMSAIRKKATPALKELKTNEEFDKFVGFTSDVSIVGFFANKDEAKTFADTADKLSDDFRFGIVYDVALIKEKNNGAQGLVNFRPFFREDAKVAYTGALNDAKTIETFVHTSSIPLAGVYKAAFKSRYDAVGLPRLAFVTKVDQENDPAGLRYILNRLRKVANEYKGKLAFTVESINESEIQSLNIKESGFAVFNNKEKFVHALTSFSVDNIKTVAKDYIEGKIEQYIKSEPIPTTESVVQHVVGKNFKKEVMESDKNVFIKFYAPWCGHCKALAPKYEELAKKMSKYEDVKIVEVDATANEYPDIFTVRGYPTLYLLKANEKNSPIQYNGSREVKDMKSWLKKQIKAKKEL